MNEIPAFVKTASIRIRRYATAYTELLDQQRHPGRMTLDELGTRVEAVLDEYDPPTARRKHSGTLVFPHLYAAARNPAEDEEEWRVPSAVVAALIAAEVEFRGPLKLSSRQNTLLAEEYERIGAQLAQARLDTHAALAYRRAVALYRINEDNESEDRCGLLLARAETRSLPPGLRRWAGFGSDVLCGHGYRPSWLLGWVVAQITVFTGIALALPLESGGEEGLATGETVYLGVVSFLSPPGLDDAGALPGAGQALFVLEGWAGVVSMSVFFALLVRKWFRM
ncbi:hypothetical protein HGA13_09620 [Nocardia speluncae]|uniref:Uncharacterized protein n=1 Tax=Nocardia speluncae TaxID=419477 RepID=A0A846XD46_9NOCA|nr:hypothetical protein [Nocardia speluncae]NKY33327.1 hypothetical protein [Nocardia speluncae]